MYIYISIQPTNWNEPCLANLIPLLPRNLYTKLEESRKSNRNHKFIFVLKLLKPLKPCYPITWGNHDGYRTLCFLMKFAGSFSFFENNVFILL